MAPDPNRTTSSRKDWHLPEGLQRAIVRLVPVALFEQPRLEALPLQAPIARANRAPGLRESRNPAKCRNRDHQGENSASIRTLQDAFGWTGVGPLVSTS
jgi:hypothetical protein